ncbi:acetylornithine transaminase [Alkalicoccus chagannorensis]|uniref:acetylornithine transaminase n=1 Tax=Alkalicoccus chagannorensis TaxID=427072 RepID=UPI0003FB4FE2|nr:acetylornithine transaminase [Alkalicoccus chagannorensis]
MDKAVQSPVMNTYKRLPFALQSGSGSYVTAEDGTSYLDFTSGIAVCNLGHAPKEVSEAVKAQMDQFWHCSNLFPITLQEEAAAVLTEAPGMDEVFFCNSGAEANEAAWKLARKYQRDQGFAEKYHILSFHQSFHGRTGGAMAATGQEKIKHGFEPVMPGFSSIPFMDQEALKQIDETTAAVFLEVVQGEGGVHPAGKNWLQQLQNVCRDKGALLIIDEIQTGAGRTGTWFAYEQFGLEPDIVTAAKGIGSGFPVGAVLASAETAASFSPGTHGSTFGGNPLAMAAVKATKEAMTEPFLEDVQHRSAWFKHQLQETAAPYGWEVRGLGFLLGIDLKEPAAPLLEKLRSNQVLALPAGENVLRILPPLTATDMELQLFLQALTQAVQAWKEEV